MPNGPQFNRTEEPQDRWLWIIQELFLDVLSRLGAGIVILFLISLSVAELLNIWLDFSAGVGSRLYKFLEAASRPMGENEIIPLLDKTDLSMFVTIVVFVLAYLIGLILSRLDIKTPDRLSFQRRAKCLWWDYLRDRSKNGYDEVMRSNVGTGLDQTKSSIKSSGRTGKPTRLVRAWKALKRFGKVGLNYFIFMKWFDDFPRHEDEVSKDNKIRKLFVNELMCSCKADCEFPYRYLKKYLKVRKYNYLAKMVPWNSDQSDPRRSRNFINLLKFRIRYYGGARVMHIVRNEAIIRLLSSMWWGARIVTWTSLGSVIVLFIFNGLREIVFDGNDAGTLSLYKIWLIIVASLKLCAIPVVTLLIALSLRWGITNQFHDLRMREVLQVLATTWTMYNDHPEWFKDIPGCQMGHRRVRDKQLQKSEYGEYKRTNIADRKKADERR